MWECEEARLLWLSLLFKVARIHCGRALNGRLYKHSIVIMGFDGEGDYRQRHLVCCYTGEYE
jgi:hypothetical protein